MSTNIVTPAWRDMHVHFRQGDAVLALAPYSARYCCEVLAMPNTSPPIDTAEAVVRYGKHLGAALAPACVPLVAVYLTPQLTLATLLACHRAGAFALKVYPADQTTGSHYGLPRSEYNRPSQRFMDLLEAAQAMSMPVLWHGEMPDSHIMDAEADFLWTFEYFTRYLSDLRMVFEHVSDARTVALVRHLADGGCKVAATITMHHLWMENGANDFMRPKFKPHWFCMPVAKRRSDWQALIEAVKHDAFFLGSDSAPHLLDDKYCAACCAGCFTAPHPEMLLDIFYRHDLLDYLIPFTSGRAGRFYNLPSVQREVRFLDQEWQVPDSCHGYAPFLAGKMLRWKLAIH